MTAKIHLAVRNPLVETYRLLPILATAMSSATRSLDDLTSRLDDLMTRDRERLGRRLRGTGRIRDDAKLAATMRQLGADIDAAASRVAARAASVPTIRYPEELPVSQRRDEIAAAIAAHQVVIVAGETGSGKTTQLPKICLELGRGVRGLIGHTQPRRIAARTVAERIAEELGVELGTGVGYQVRFTGRVGEQTLVKLMTDGILLAETQHDRMLHGYDTLIIDEAHERSLNIDFLLGYVKQLLPRRPDLKVIITSATIDPQRFSAHFGQRHGEPDRGGLRPDVPGGGPLPAARGLHSGLSRPPPRTMTAPNRATRCRRSARRWTSCSPRGPGTCSCSCPASARSATPPTR